MSTEALMKLIRDKKNAGGGQKTTKLAVGHTRVRILSGWRGAADPLFWHDWGQHFIRDAAGQVKAVVTCNDRTFGKPCEACVAVSEAIKTSTSDSQTNAFQQMAANGRILLNAILPESASPEEVHVLEVPATVLTGFKKTGGIIGLLEQYPTMLDPNTGFDIMIEKAGSGKNGTTYNVQPTVGVSKPVPAHVLAKMNNLDNFVQTYSEEKMRRALSAVSAHTGRVYPLLGAPTAASLGVTAENVIPGMIVESASPLGAPITTGPGPVTVTPGPVVDGSAPMVTPSAPVVTSVAPVVTAPPVPTTVAPTTLVAVVAPPVATTGDPDLDKLLAGLSI